MRSFAPVSLDRDRTLKHFDAPGPSGFYALVRRAAVAVACGNEGYR